MNRLLGDSCVSLDEAPWLPNVTPAKHKAALSGGLVVTPEQPAVTPLISLHPKTLRALKTKIESGI